MRRTLSRDLVLALLILIGPVPMVAAPMGDALAQERTSKGGPLRAPLSASVRFSDPQGVTLNRVMPGQPFQIALSFTAQIGDLPANLAPLAWIRDKDDTDLPCGETAAAYRASGQASLGSVALNGLVLGVANRDGSVTVLDPQRSIGSANLLAARRFDPPPVALAADARNGTFLLALPGRAPGQGQVVAMTPQGGTRVLAKGLNRPGALVAAQAGGAWLLEVGSGDVLRLRDGAVQRLALAARAVATDAIGRRLAVLSADRVTVLQDDAPPRHLAAPGANAVALSADAVLWLAGQTLHIAWLDATDLPAERVALSGDFDRMAISPEGRMLFLYARDRTGFALVDLARGRVVQGADTGSPVAEIAFLLDTAILRLADQSAVGVMDLRAIAPGREAVLGRVVLGPARPAEESRDGRLLAPLLPEPALLAVHAESFTGFVIDQRHAVSGKPPMEALRLRGGIPHLVQPLDRGLRPISGGAFITSALLPRPGNWELVVSAGIGQGAFCAMVPGPAAPAVAADAPGRILARAAPQGSMDLLFQTADGRPVAALSGTLDLAALIGSWRQRQDFVTDTAGIVHIASDLAQHLPLVVTLSGDTGFAPLVLEEQP